MENGERQYKKKIRLSEAGCSMRGYLEQRKLNTVCSSARCPNQEECYGRGTATFMILGDVCTRDCRFCAVGAGTPPEVDSGEPGRIAQAVAEKGLKHVVVTSVTRDDLPDGGAGHFAAVINAVRRVAPGTALEVLTPDFKGDTDSLRTVMEARPEVFNHNIETVPSLYAAVRPQAVYRRSLDLLRTAAHFGTGAVMKSGMMVGVGETDEELDAVFADLAAAGCSVLTIGQYFQPDRTRLPVARYYEDEEFARLRERGVREGLKTVVAGRFVRSSYRAGAVYAGITGG